MPDFEFKVTIPADTLAELAALLRGCAPSAEAPEPVKVEKPAPIPTPAPVTAPVTAPAAKAVTLADLRSLVIELSAAGKKPQVVEIVRDYAPKLPGIPPESYPDVLERLEALK